MSETLEARLAGPLQMALAGATAVAADRGHQVINAAHLYLYLVDRYGGLVESTVPGIDVAAERSRLEAELANAPAESDTSLGEVLVRAVSIASGEGKEKAELRHAILALAPRPTGASPQPPSDHVPAGGWTPSTQPTPKLNEFGRDLTREAAEGKLYPIIGRDLEIDAVIQTLCRLDKPNALLVGPAGVGKTAIVEGVAQLIVSGDIPGFLQNARIVELQPSNLVAGAGIVGELQDRIKAIIAEAQQIRASTETAGMILFIDEFHTAVGAGGPMGLQDVAGQIKPALDRGEIAVIGATTDREYEQHIRRDAALERRFDIVHVDELSPAHSLEILKKLRPRWSKKRGVTVDDGALEEAVFLAGAHMRNRHFPDKAIDVTEQTVAFVYAGGESSVTAETIREVVSRRIGVPLGSLQRNLAARLEEASAFLKTRVFGQDHVIDAVVEVLRPRLLGLDLNAERPNGVLFFTGPTGVGKTELAKALAEFLFGARSKFLRFDMSEFSEPHTVTRLTGAPPSYIGFDMGAPILEKITANPYSVVLLDEFEKAHPAVHQLFLQVFDSGVLTDNQGRHVYFSDVVIVLTANIQELKRRGIGFGAEEVREDARETLRRHFPPEFVNRIDYVGLFHDLPPELVREILEKRTIPELAKRLHRKGIELEVTAEAIALLAERGFDEESGARELQRVIDADVVGPVSRFVPDATPKEPIRVRVDVRDGSLVIEGMGEDGGATPAEDASDGG